MSENTPTTHTYNTVQPYMAMKNCAAALEFYKTAFGATERMRMKRPDGSIMHAEIQLGDTCLMMADENAELGFFSPEHYGGSPIGLNINVKDCDAQFHRAIAAGAKAVREPADQSYGDRNAGVVDPFGYKWWISAPIKAK